MRISDSKAFRFWAFIGLPLLIIIHSCFNQRGYFTGLVNTFGIYIILVASLNLVNGFSGIFSMGHAAFMAIGAYIAAFCTLNPAIKKNFLPAMPSFIQNMQLPMIPAIVLGGIAAGIVALAVGFCVLRMKGHYLSVATLGLIIIVRSVLDNADSFTNGARGITGLPAHATTWTIYCTALISVYVLYRTIRSGTGRELIALRDDFIAARAMGINTTRHRIMAFVLSAFFAGVGGVLWGHMQSVISGKFYYYDLSFRIVQTSIIGGMYTLSGAFVGPLFMTVVPELLRPLEAGFNLFGLHLPQMFGLSKLLMSAFLIVLIIFRRQGIMGYNEIIVDSIFDPATYKAALSPKAYAELGNCIRERFLSGGKKRP
jgi:branched-chain amino acid transport system permease protein